MKKYAKKAAALFGAALFMLPAFPLSAGAEEITSGDYDIDADGGTAAVTAYNGEDENILIPASIEGNSITEIAPAAFQMNADILSVEIPDGVTKIGDHAFAIDTGIETLTLPATITEIGENAFQQCSSLNTVNFAGDEAAWKAITIAEGNELLTAITPSYNATLTAQDSASSESSSSSEATESESASSEESSSAAASSEETSSAAVSSEETASESASAEGTTGTTGTTASSGSAAPAESAAADPVPQGSPINIAYLFGGILIGIAVLDIIYFSIKGPAPAPTVPEQDPANPQR